MRARINEYHDQRIEIWEGPEFGDDDEGEWRDAKPEEFVPALIAMVGDLQRKLKRLAE